MSYNFSAIDIFEMAERIEENGFYFYKNASESIKEPIIKKFLIKLAQREQEHVRIFQDMKKDLNNIEKLETVFDPNNEAIGYINALSDIQIFFKKEINISSIREILIAAIIAEKDSIVFYTGMKKLVPEKFGKNKIDEIIFEEMDHLKLLSNELKAIKFEDDQRL